VIFVQKKTHPIFSIPNYGAKNRKRVLPRWRKQRGIDNKKRVKYAFMGAEPTIGYGNPEELKGVRVNGNRTVLVHNPNELKVLIERKMLQNYDVTIAKGVSQRKRIAITEAAKKAKVHVTNGAYK
jgi:large subunit ribosomal protein L32e